MIRHIKQQVKHSCAYNDFSRVADETVQSAFAVIWEYFVIMAAPVARKNCAVIKLTTRRVLTLTKYALWMHQKV
jgi:hypothetical protein